MKQSRVQISGEDVEGSSFFFGCQGKIVGVAICSIYTTPYHIRLWMAPRSKFVLIGDVVLGSRSLSLVGFGVCA